MMRCPKCQQPLAEQDEGLYICCAGAPTRWQCTDCGQASEGFAFAYGRCPQCGGKLVLREVGEPAAADEAAAMAAVRTAFEIELGGRAFYQRAALDCDDEAQRALFTRFAVMEGEHMETLARRYHLEIQNPSAGFRLRTATVFAGLDQPPTDGAALFRLAIALEKRAAAFYADHAAQTAAGSAERRLYEELAAEEREHARILSAEFTQWRSRRPGLRGEELSADALLSTRGRDAAIDVQINGAAMLIAGHDADRVAVECGGERLTYGELRDRVARAAAVWRARGLRPGDRVAVKLPDGLDWVVCWLGTIWAGGIAVGVNPRVPAPEWHYILEEAGFNVIVAESAEETPEPWRSRVILLADGRREVAAAQPVAPTIVDEEMTAFWLHTSGTSGKPKAVVHTHRCIREIARVSAERMGITSDDRLFASSRLFFAYPLTNLLLAGLRLGATLLLDPQWPTPQSVVATVERMQPTVFFSVPSLYRNLLHEGLAARLPAAGVRVCVSAGEALPASLRAAWREAAALPMIDGYGASEVLVLVLTAVDGDDGLMPSPGIEATPLDADAAAAGMPTRLLIRCATQANGYLDRPAAQADSFRHGLFCPADLFLRTEGGGWRFAGREDALIKIKGRWVNLAELEEGLGAGIQGLRESAAVCVPDADGVDAVAYFYSADGGDGERVRQQIAERVAALPNHKRPTWITSIEALPRGPTGKLLRRKLVEQFGRT